MDELLGDQTLGQTLEAWVVGQCEEWRNAQEANYFSKWNEYYRIWRGHWDAQDKTINSERSKLIHPASQQAVESSVSEVEEATFGRGSFFDVRDDMDDNERQDIEYLKNKLAQEFKYNRIRREAAEAILNAAIYGTGIAEITIDYKTHYAPATQADADGIPMAGRMKSEKVCVGMRPIKPHNLRIPDTATSIEDALGVGIEELVAPDYVYDLQEQGIYEETDSVLHGTPSDYDLEADPTLDSVNQKRVKLLRYYGKVPRHLLEEVEWYEPNQNSEGDSYYVEAIVVVANDGILLKAEPNPYLMNDRPLVSFQWDIVPGRFWGRGVVEKGYNPQKALDAELRQRRDAMALLVAPMIGVDATRLTERGKKLTVQPGKSIMTDGDPREVLHPFNFGQLPQTSYMETAALQEMVQQATGAIDSAGIAGGINGEATAAGISMSLGAIIKRHKRTLVNFQDSFLIPFVQKAAYRYMQFDADNFPVQDYNFQVTSSLGIMAREYDVGQLVQLLQTTSPDSPIYPALVEQIIDQMNLSNREELIATLRKAQEPNEQQMAAQQAQMQQQQEIHAAQMQVLHAQAAESMARAAKYEAEAKAQPARTHADLINALSDINNDAVDDFERGLKIVEQEHKRKIDVGKLAVEELKARNK